MVNNKFETVGEFFHKVQEDSDMDLVEGPLRMYHLSSCLELDSLIAELGWGDGVGDFLSFIRSQRYELESGWFQWITLPLPASLSIQSGLNNPRYPSLKGIMGAKRKDIKIIPETEHNNQKQFQEIDKVFIPKTDKKTEFIEGDVDTTVTKIIKILKTEVKVI